MPAPSTGQPPAHGRRTPTEVLAQRRRREIIEAAYDVFCEKGYSAAGIADIAERLGMGHGTFYRYFKNKRDILEQVVEYGVEQIVEVLRREAATPATTLDQFREQLRHIGERLFSLLEADPGLGQVVLLEATSIDHELTQRVLGLLDTFGALAATFLEQGVRRGFLRADLDTERVGRAITALALPELFAALRGATGPEQRQRYVEAMVRLVFDGIAVS